MSDHILLEASAILPDLHCPTCNVGLDVWSDDDEGGWDEKTGQCPKCVTTIIIDKSITTRYIVVRWEKEEKE